MPAGIGGFGIGGGTGVTAVSLGRIGIGNCCGHWTMNICARLYAYTAVKAVSKAVGKGEPPAPARR